MNKVQLSSLSKQKSSAIGGSEDSETLRKGDELEGTKTIKTISRFNHSGKSIVTPRIDSEIQKVEKSEAVFIPDNELKLEPESNLKFAMQKIISGVKTNEKGRYGIDQREKNLRPLMVSVFSTLDLEDQQDIIQRMKNLMSNRTLIKSYLR